MNLKFAYGKDQMIIYQRLLSLGKILRDPYVRCEIWNIKEFWCKYQSRINRGDNHLNTQRTRFLFSLRGFLASTYKISNYLYYFRQAVWSALMILSAIKDAQHLSLLAVFSENVFGMSSMCTRWARIFFFRFCFFVLLLL